MKNSQFVAKKQMNVLLFIAILNEMGRAVELPSIDMCPTPHTFVVGNGWHNVSTNVLDHQLADGPIYLCGVHNMCLVGCFMELEIMSRIREKKGSGIAH